ncbi:MAG TPA: metallophosphoesterase family protein [Bryobacteraceae bacterium]|nr:metallophosphoesterase family protein [Bryobacteraceae bacterium]
MRYLILSDLHANWEALQAVLGDARGKYDQIVCCGDLVGYGPDPNAVTEWVRTSVGPVVRGNHDRGCAGLIDLEWFNPVARTANLWTATQLTKANLNYLRDLPTGPVTVAGFQISHGSPFDEDEYLLTLKEATGALRRLETSLAFFGQTHIQGAFTWMHGRFEAVSRAQLPLYRDAAWLINPGAVGQPRDGDPRAAYALYDTGLNQVLQCRVSYDYEATARKILAAGLPDMLAARLAIGR